MPRCSVVNDDGQATRRRKLPDDDEQEARETVPGQADPARHCDMIAGGRRRAAFGMRVPVANIMQVARE